MQVKIPFLKPDVIDSFKASVSSAEATLSAVNISYHPHSKKLQTACFGGIDVLKYMETVTGYSYEIINLAILFSSTYTGTDLLLFGYEKNKERS